MKTFVLLSALAAALLAPIPPALALNVAEPQAPIPGPGQEVFYGRINYMPSQGFLGMWEIAGRVVRVTEKTTLDDKTRMFKVGHRVDVTGKTVGSEFLADSVSKR